MVLTQSWRYAPTMAWVALSEADKQQGRFVPIDTRALADRQAVRGRLKAWGYEVLWVRRAFADKGGSAGRLSRVCNDLTCDG